MLIGVTGAGKTTVGRALADRLGWLFLEGDDFHSTANRDRLSRGMPLTDEDRWPWLAAIRDRLEVVVARGNKAVLACSALKDAYRSALVPRNASPGSVRFVFLRADPATLKDRLATRTGHFAAPSILASQLATLEVPADALHVDATEPPDTLARQVVAAFGLGKS